VQMDYLIETRKVLCFAKELGLEVGRAGSIHPVSARRASRKPALSCVALCVLCGVWLHRTEPGWASANRHYRKLVFIRPQTYM
jgi:hypothetical protein